jgi:hypothetical protein
MPNPLIAVAGIGAGGAVAQANAAKKAAASQAAAADAGIAEQARQFDIGIEEQRKQLEAARALMQPYVQAGGQGLQAMTGLMGLQGPAAQGRAIEGIAGGQEMAALTQQGENAILQQASATGGLRGGNTQGALAQFRPQVLSTLINQQMARYGGLAEMGQAAAAGVGSAGQATAAGIAGMAAQQGTNVAALLQQRGAAQAGGALASGQAFGNFLGGLGGMIGRFGIPETGIPKGQTMFSRWGF